MQALIIVLLATFGLVLAPNASVYADSSMEYPMCQSESTTETSTETETDEEPDCD